MPSLGPHTIMLIAGLALISVGILGGGIEIKEVKIPQLSIFPRSASFIIGCLLTVWVLMFQEQADKRDDLGSAIADRSIDVQGVKSSLKQLGLYSGPIDGKPEPAYFAAIGSFQQSRHIEPSGLVDHGTLQKLRRGLAELPSKHPPVITPNVDLVATTTSKPQAAIVTPIIDSSPVVPSTSKQPLSIATPALEPPPSPPTKNQSSSLCRIQANKKTRPSPGVNCTVSGSLDEVEICASVDLCELDWQLFSVYRIAMASLDKTDQVKLVKDEAAWVRKRGECKSNVSCIATAYKTRINQLH